MQEWLRVFRLRYLGIIAVAVLLNIGIFLYGSFSGESVAMVRFANRTYNDLIEHYQNYSLQDACQLANEDYRALRKYKNNKENEEMEEREILDVYQSLSDEEQIQYEKQLARIKNKLTYLSGYRDSIAQVFSNVDSMKRFRIFSNEDSFSYNNIIRTAQDFERVKDNTVLLDDDSGVDYFLHHKATYYFAAALLLILIYSFFDERDNGMWPILHNTPRGREVFAVKRIGIIIFASFSILFVLYVSAFLTAMFRFGGWSSLQNPIQTLPEYAKFTHVMSKGTYITVLFLLSYVVLCAISLVIYSMFVLFRNRNHMLVFTAVFTGGEILLYRKIEIQSVYNALHYMNIVSILNINEIYSTYLNWGFGTHIFSVLFVVLFSLILLTICLCIMAVVRYGRMRPVSKVSALERILKIVHMQYQKVFAKEPMLFKEIHKLLITAKGLWAVIALIIIAVYFSLQGQMIFSEKQKEWDAAYLTYGGADWSYFEELIDTQNIELAQAEQNMLDMEALYKAGEISFEEYVASTSAYNMKKSEIGYTKEYREKLSYAHRVEEKYNIKTWLISDRGYEEIFGTHASQRELILVIALTVVLVIVLSESFLLEYRTGMYGIVHSAANGRTWMLVHKIVSGMLLALAIVAVVYGIDAVNLYHTYGTPFLKAPLLSLSFMYDKASFAKYFTIGGYLCILAAVRIGVAFITAAIALLTSKMIGKKGSRSLTPIVIVGVLVIIYMLHQATGLV